MSYHPMASDRLAPAPYLQASSQYGSSAPNLYEHFLSQSFVVNGHFLQDIANAIGSSAPSTWEHFEAGALPSDAAKLARQQIILCFLNEGRQHAKKAAERARETGNNSYMLYSHYDNVTPVLGSLRPCRHSPEHPPSFTVHIIFRRGGTHDPDHLHYASIELLRAHDHKQHIYTMCLAATGGNWTGRDVQAIFDNALLTAFLFVQDGIPFHIQSALRDTLKQRHDRTTLPIYNWRPQFSDRDGAQHPTVPPSYASPAFTSTAVPSYFHLPPTPNPIPIQPRPAPEQPKSFKPTRSHYRHLADFYHKHKEMNTSGNSSGLSDLERAEIAAHLTRTDDSRGPFPEQRVQEYFDNRQVKSHLLFSCP